jgi:hypothetical protein
LMPGISSEEMRRDWGRLEGAIQQRPQFNAYDIIFSHTRNLEVGSIISFTLGDKDRITHTTQCFRCVRAVAKSWFL